MIYFNPNKLTDKELIKEIELSNSSDPYVLELINRFNRLKVPSSESYLSLDSVIDGDYDTVDDLSHIT